MELQDTYSLSAGLKRYHDSGQFTDLTIRVAGEEFKVHRVIVCSQSEYFSRLYDGDWKETARNEVDIEEAEPGVVEAMICFMYNRNYDSSGGPQCRVSPLFLNAQVYSLAERLGIPCLMEKAKEIFKDIASTCWDMDDFPPVILEVYTTTPETDRGLRDLIVRTCIANLESLLKKGEFLSVLESCAPFSADIARTLAKISTVQRNIYQCPDCRNQFEASISGGQISYCVHCGSCDSNWDTHKVK
ncbi:predicted protein [Uncinocarpus reesii 1704]|uniref:BTB domain-containing protein n=1 Tax=Uncinocarpus reesii (strain UAMH 1704) TaxID=336963 RepID=C4JVD1_UNCRE|nr:uncharacterized protein UREG_06523 [Uncinocarpus reesii 1704]EEP81658.1 predicted protein [Uncinocarpus reesii 1704]